MKKINPISKLILIAFAGAIVAVLAFAHGAHQEAAQTPAQGTEQQATAPASDSSYPLDHCVVTGNKLGSMGDPVIKNYDGREVRFCCPMCPPKFEKDKKAYLKKMDDEIITAQKATYPLENCVVSGEPLVHSDMGDPVDYVYNNRLVRFCCNGCVKAFNKNPDRFLKKIDEAAAAKTETPSDTQEHTN